MLNGSPREQHGKAVTQSPVVQSSSASAAETQRPSSGLRHSTSLPSEHFTISDLALLHHWTITASLTIVEAPHALTLWQNVFPRIGFQHAFVLHAILSVSALHLAYLYQDDKTHHLHDAAHHHTLASEGMRACMGDVDRDVSDALFACAAMNILYVFAMSGPLGDDSKSDDLSAGRRRRALNGEWIAMIHGAGAVLKPAYEQVAKGPLAPLLSIGNWDELDPQGYPDDERFKKLREAWADSTDAEYYNKALDGLRRCNAFLKQTVTDAEDTAKKWGYNGQWAGPWIWLLAAPEEYFLRLRQRQPLALLILAYFGALLKQLDAYWFIRGWGCDIVIATDEVLGTYWSEWTAWPREAVGIR